MAMVSTLPSYVVDQLIQPVWPDELGPDQDSAHLEAPVVKKVVTVQFSRKTAGNDAPEEIFFKEELTVSLICQKNGCGSRDLIKKGFDTKYSHYPQNMAI